jgi:hypothetical protein
MKTGCLLYYRCTYFNYNQKCPHNRKPSLPCKLLHILLEISQAMHFSKLGFQLICKLRRQRIRKHFCPLVHDPVRIGKYIHFRRRPYLHCQVSQIRLDSPENGGKKPLRSVGMYLHTVHDIIYQKSGVFISAAVGI